LALQEKMGFVSFEGIYLDETDLSSGDEIQLKVTSLKYPGEDIFNKLEVIRLSWRSTASVEQQTVNSKVPLLSRKALKKTATMIPARAYRRTARPERGSALRPLPFHSPLMQQQLKGTPSWVKNPNIYDPCEVEGVLHTTEECGLTDSYFHG
jgi:hypothetical protein